MPGVFLILLALLCEVPLAAQESAVGTRIRTFADSLNNQLSSRAARGSALAIANFDNKSEEAVRQDLGFAVSEIITENFQRSGQFNIVEKKHIDQLVRTLELGLTGLYDSDKVASIGKLINARYLMVGSITQLAGFYRVSVRVVEVETGSVALSDSVELDSALLENAAEKYQPPRYRLFIGSSMSWFAFTPNSLGTYSIGLALGGMYNLAKDQWLSLQTIFFFWHYGIRSALVDTPPGTTYNTNYSLINTFIVMAGYGYRFPLSGAISIQPHLGAGAVVGGLRRSETVTILSPYFTELVEPAPEVWITPMVQARVDLVFLEKSPVSFYIGTGYFMYPKSFQKTYREMNTDLLLNGIKLEGAIMVYF